MKLKDFKNPPKDFIFNKGEPDYILLGENEIIQKGDQYQCKTGQWVKTGLYGGKKVTGFPYRRKVTKDSP